MAYIHRFRQFLPESNGYLIAHLEEIDFEQYMESTSNMLLLGQVDTALDCAKELYAQHTNYLSNRIREGTVSQDVFSQTTHTLATLVLKLSQESTARTRR